MSLNPTVSSPSATNLVCTRKKRQPELREDWPLAKVTDHVKQNHYFAKPTPAEIEKLAGNLQRNTQTDAVEITPQGVIISGHKRVLAARHLGWETIRVLVRYDLQGDERAIEHRLIEANENRRHLSTFERARLQYRMWQLYPGELTRKVRGQINAELAKTLDIVDRQVSRYIRLFDGPPELLEAVTDERLRPSHAFAVLAMPSEQAEPILAVLRDNPESLDVQDMIKQAVAGDKAPRTTKPAALLKQLLKAGDALAGQAAVLTGLVTADQRKQLARLRRLLGKVEGKSNSAA